MTDTEVVSLDQKRRLTVLVVGKRASGKTRLIQSMMISNFASPVYAAEVQYVSSHLLDEMDPDVIVYFRVFLLRDCGACRNCNLKLKTAPPYSFVVWDRKRSAAETLVSGGVDAQATVHGIRFY